MKIKDFKKKLELKKLKGKNFQTVFLATFLAIILSSFFVALASAASISYPDPTDDLRCFTEDDLEGLEDMWGEGESPEHPSEIVDAVLSVWSEGTMSATPDCIDMISVTLEEVWANDVKLTIEVEGSFDDCPMAIFLLWGNCSGNEYVIAIMIVTEIDEGDMESTSAYYSYVDENDNHQSGNADMDSGMDEVSVTYPKPEEDCSLVILGLAMDSTGAVLCCDLFPNALYENPSSGGGEGGFQEHTGSEYYDGWDPITNFFDNLAQFLFFFMCGRLGFLYLMGLFVIAFKLMMDRKNMIVANIGMVGNALTMWLMLWYMIEIDIMVADALLDFSLLGLLEFLACLFFIIFVVYTYANHYGFVNDGEWSFVLAYAFMIIEAGMFMTPIYFYECAGQPYLTLVLQIITVGASGILLGFSEKYSKGRLP